MMRLYQPLPEDLVNAPWEIQRDFVEAYNIAHINGSKVPVNVARKIIADKYASVSSELQLVIHKNKNFSNYAGHNGVPHVKGGKPGQHYGTSGTSGDVSFSSSLEGVDVAEFDTWEDTGAGGTGRKKMAKDAYESIQNGSGCFLVKDKKEVVGIMAYEENKKDLYVAYLSTKRRGHGAQMMKKICAKAASENKGISLIGAKPAVPFYVKMGMKEIKKGIYSFNADEAREFSNAN